VGPSSSQLRVKQLAVTMADHRKDLLVRNVEELTGGPKLFAIGLSSEMRRKRLILTGLHQPR